MAEIRVSVVPDFAEFERAMGQMKDKALKGMAGGGGNTGGDSSGKDVTKSLGFMAIAANQTVEILQKILDHAIKFSPAMIKLTKLFEVAIGLTFKPLLDIVAMTLLPLLKDYIVFIRGEGGKKLKERGEQGKTLLSGLGPIGEIVGAVGGTAFGIGELQGENWGKKFGQIVKQTTVNLSAAFDMFIDDLGKAWEGLSEWVTTGLTEGLKQAWKGLQEIWGVIATGLEFAWTNVLKPVWDAISGALEFAWTNVLKPVWDAISEALEFAWTNVLKPVWDAISEALQAAWDALQPIWDNLKDAFDAFWDAIDPILKGVQAAFQGLIDWLKELPIVGDILKAYEFQTGGELPHTGLFYGHKGERVVPGHASQFPAKMDTTVYIYGGRSGDFLGDMRAANRSQIRDLRRLRAF